MKLFSIMILLFTLISCGNQGNGGAYSESAPTGTIAKQWAAMSNTRSNLYSAEAADFSGGLTVTFARVRKSEKKYVGSREYWVNTTSDCTYTIDTGTPGQTEYTTVYQSTLTSGNPYVCNALTPQFGIKHYRASNRDFDILVVAGAYMR